jgi:hypothetical protein
MPHQSHYNESHPGEDDLQFEPESVQGVNLEIDSPTTIDRLKEMTWTDRICSLTRYGGLLFGPSVFVTDILYYVDVGFENNTYQVAYLGFLFLQPILNLVCVLLFGTYLLNYTEYKQQRRMGAYIIGLSPLIALMASVKLIGFATLFSKFASGVALGIWMLIIISPIFKTFPILLIQGLNNSDMAVWTTPLAMFCYVTAVLSCCKEVIELAYYLGGDLIVRERKEITSYMPKLMASQFYDKGDKVDSYGDCGWPALIVPFCGWNVLNCANLYKADERFLATKSYWIEAVCCVLCLPPLASVLLRGRSKMSGCQLLGAVVSCGAYPTAIPSHAIEILKP